MKRLPLLFLVFFWIASSGCLQTFYSYARDGAKKEGMTRDEQEVVMAIANREALMKKNKEGVYEIDKNRMTLDDVVKSLDRALVDLEEIQSVKEDGWQKYNEAHELWDYFRNEERIYRFLRDSARARQLQARFYELIGESPDDGGRGKKHAYDPRLFIAESDAEAPSKFASARIEDAKTNGKLKLTQTFLVFLNDKYGLKTVDPNDPNDPNRFLLKENVWGLEIKTFAIIEGEPVKAAINEYIEATRVILKRGAADDFTAIVRESRPALKVFSSANQRLNIAVGDSDKENEIGFGKPDFVEAISGIQNGFDLYLLRKDLINRLFKTPAVKGPRPKRDPPRVEIARVSGTTTDIDSRWQKSPSSAGWTVPFEYANRNRDNYNVKVVFKDDGGVNGGKKIAYIVKEWHSTGNHLKPSVGAVIEYYRPKPPYDKDDILEAKVLREESTKKLTVTRLGEQTATGFVYKSNIFAVDKPEMIDYAYGNRRFRIADRAGNDGIYESRKEISRPADYKTGVYEEEGVSSSD